MNVILGKCTGGGVKRVNFFSIDCERSTVYMYISARGFCVEKTVFFFGGVWFCTSSKGFFFCLFFLVIMRPQGIPLWVFSFLLIFLFFFYYFFDF